MGKLLDRKWRYIIQRLSERRTLVSNKQSSSFANDLQLVTDCLAKLLKAVIADADIRS